ncbi:hypothetical protein ATE67_16140 [Sphingopyxis sp. H050]|jgi:hypothetical protein|uniref:hypothetical protein n=1 Tax=Sphingopyxis sp. H050 TaxID=1759072 RepID=UPI000736B564|nr:hypothetical protein [Sphingopyxis sp. H050]KTE19065.1 hypothetical protein ATE67_16140 [Sphingopyxis sp. H050]
MKKFFLPALALFALVPATARAEEQRFEHDGRIYSYTVTQADGYRVISGIEEKSGKPFKLRIGEHRVRGTVGSQQVNFALRDVDPVVKVTILASR